MRKIVFVLLGISMLSLNAQEADPILLTVGGKDVTLSEFNAIYNKNNNKTEQTEASVKEYLELYTKFKLKVREAEELGLDTMSTFKEELAGYRKQLAQPYLTDKEVTEKLIKEVYERMKYDVRGMHILINLPAEAYGKDTVEAYNKIVKARERIIKGEDFEKVAKEVSEDPSVSKNGGDLGYFTALRMVYPFEVAAYTTKVGDVSHPLRTRFGYHILKVTDKRPAKGEIKTAHIMIKTTESDTGEVAKAKEQKINEIYELLIKENQDFATLAKQYSEDQSSASKGGELPVFNAGKMIESFENAAFALEKDGDISKPIKTEFGWHIIKRLSYQPLGTYEDLYNSIKQKVSKDARSNKSKEALVKKIKDENNFKEYLAERNDFYKIITEDELLDGNMNIDKAKGLNKVMFGFYAKDGDKVEYTQTDFANFLANRASPAKRIGPKPTIDIKTIINLLYQQKVEETAIQFKDNRLPKTNDEFRLLMQEYRDGILLFDLTDKKVWSKAVKDTTGLKEFYEKNKEKYMWEERANATIYICSNDEVVKKVTKILKVKLKKGYSSSDILKMINTDSQLDLTIKEGKFTKNENEYLAKATWEELTVSTVKDEKGTAIVVIHEILPPAPKELDEVRGLVTSDYQNFLEEEWVKSLKEKYKVTVNNEVLKLVK
ncbi:MAG: peptidylprolyl isomerase [Vicingus serpentipes]|nr:peptidylprolyl isomerase [Vicingus serpentipes]